MSKCLKEEQQLIFLISAVDIQPKDTGAQHRHEKRREFGKKIKMKNFLCGLYVCVYTYTHTHIRVTTF